MSSGLFASLISEKEFVSLPVSILNKIMGKNSISNFVRPYKFHHEKDFIWCECNDGLNGVVIEVTPRVRMGKDTSEAIEGIIRQLEDDMYFSINLYGLENNQSQIDSWVKSHILPNDTYVEKLVKMFGAFFELKTKEQLAPNVKNNLKSFRLFLSIKHKKHNVLHKTVSEMFRILQTSQFHPRYPSEQSLKELYWELLNGNEDFKEMPRYTKKQYFNKQTTSPATIAEDDINSLRIGKICNKTDKFVGKYWSALAIQDISENFDISEFDQKIGVNYGNLGKVESSQFKNNFIISLNVVKAKKSELRTIGLNQKIIKNQVATDDEVDVKQAKREHRMIMNKIGGDE
ncbi:MAG: TraC family protein, partial [Campylobacterota bacterium]